MRSFVLTVALVSTALATPALAQHMGDGGGAPASPPPLFEGMGAWTRKVTTSSPEAQKYFNQGLTLCYGFNHDEGIRSFREAVRLDPTCAMAWWGIAYAAGPNINMPMDPDHAKIALDAATMAKSLAKGGTAVERELIDAVAARYSPDSTVSRTGLDSLWARNMKALSKRHPDDPDAATIAAEAMLDLNPWNQWTLDGKPNPGTLEAVAMLEAVLKKWPDMPAANHFYIHAVEASPNPERALVPAARLEKLVPGQGHLVHMPSHIYARVGRYDDAIKRNEVAVAVDEKYIADQKPQGIYPLMYYNHNIQFIWFSSMMEGRSAEALSAARKMAGNVPPEVIAEIPLLEFLTPYPVCAMARFGKWDDIIAEPMPPPTQHYATAMFHYIRGLAYAAKGDAKSARVESDSLNAIAPTIPIDLQISINLGSRLLRVASQDLAGHIAVAEKRPDDAVKSLRAAIAVEDSLHYDEPPTFPWSIRPRLGAVLMSMGRAKEAEDAYRGDLRRHPENGWALRGLANALRAQKKDADAEAVEARFRKAWARADVTLSAKTD
jgi:tetratricopeptide (TPR) repeat protein